MHAIAAKGRVAKVFVSKEIANRCCLKLATFSGELTGRVFSKEKIEVIERGL